MNTSFKQRLRALSTPYKIVLAASAAIAILVTWSTIAALLAPGVPPGFADKDFANYWMAGKLILNGQTGDLFGPQPIYFAHLTAAFGEGYPWHNWSYPPHVLLILWPLGFFGYKTALLFFLAVTGAFFVWALRAFAGRGSIMAWVAAAPLITHNFYLGQNGYLSAGLGLGALALREKRPVLAGVLLGFLTIKPQLGFLFPFLLLAERRWTVIASAAVTTAVLVAASAAVFGVSAWEGYIADVVPYQTFVMRELEGTFLSMVPSVYGTLRNWSVGADLALPLHFFMALPAAAITIVAFFRVDDARDRAVILLIATFLITPYAVTYDLGLFVAALAIMAGTGEEEGSLGKNRTMLLAIGMLLPVAMTPLGENNVPIAPIVMMAIFFVALRESSFFGRPVPENGKKALVTQAL